MAVSLGVDGRCAVDLVPGYRADQGYCEWWLRAREWTVDWRDGIDPGGCVGGISRCGECMPFGSAPNMGSC